MQTSQRARVLQSLQRREIAGLAIFIFSIIGFEPLLGAFNDERYADLGFGMALLAVVAWLSLTMIDVPLAQPPSCAPFEPLSLEDHPNPWERDEEVSRIVGQLEAPNRESPVFVVGPSGVGKSIIVRRFLGGHGGLEIHGFADHRYSNPENVRHEIEGLIVRKPWKSTVIVLDQFESLITRWPDHFRKNGGFNDVIRRASLAGIGVIIVCRSDRFYDLRILDDLAPSPFDVVDVPSIGERLTTGDRLLAGISRAFEPIVDLSNTGQTVSEWVGQLLESQERLRPNITTLELECAAAAVIQTSAGAPIDASRNQALLYRDLCMRFLDNQLIGVSDTNKAQKLLFAFASLDPSASPTSTADLVSAVFENEEDCSRVLKELEERRFLLLNSGTYRLSHDALAPMCEQYCSARLDGWETRIIRSRLSRNDKPVLQPHEFVLRGKRFGNAALAITILIGALRTLFAGSPIWHVFSDAGERVISSGETMQFGLRPDRLFGLVAIVLAAWANYVVRFVEGTFLRVKSPLINALGFIAVGLVVAGMTFAAFFVQFWGIAASVIGIWLAGSMYVVSRNTPESVKKHLLSYSFPTGMFMVSVAVVTSGLYMFSFRDGLDLHGSAHRFHTGSLLMSVGLLLLCILLTRMHTDPVFTSRIRGMLSTDYRDEDSF